jgi:hypothetical protein
LVKMNLSRAAKKFRAQMPHEPEAPKPGKTKKSRPPTAPIPVPAPEPVVETVTPIESIPEPAASPFEVAEAASPTTPKKVWPAKAKRPRFVRERVEKRERPAAAALPPRSTKFAARLLTKNLAVPPKDDAKLPR